MSKRHWRRWVRGLLVPRSSVPLGHRPIRLPGTSLFTARSCLKTGLFRSSRGSSGAYTRNELASYFSSDELFAGVATYSFFRFIMSLACQKKCILVQSDIQAAYLQADLSESIWMETPTNMWVNWKPPRDNDGNESCCLQKKSLYGLRQAGHA